MTGGHTPGTGKACESCKRVRKKCDLESPCGRCHRLGVQCSGPKQATRFVNRDACTFRSQTQRQALVKAYRNRTLEAAEQEDFIRAGQTNEQPVTVLRPEPDLSLIEQCSIISAGTSCMLSVYPAFVDEFQPGKSIGIFNADRTLRPFSVHYTSIATCIRGLLPLVSFAVPMLDLSLFSLLVLYYGMLHRDAGLVNIARSSYTVTLGQCSQRLSNAISEANSSASRPYQTFACVSIALQVFEYLNDQGEHGTGHLAHVDGALNFLRTLGPGSIQRSADLRTALSGLRGIVVFVAIERRTPSFLSEPDWLEVPFQGSEKTVRDRLNDLGLLIPVHLRALDTLRSGLKAGDPSANTVVDQCLHQLNEISLLQTRFEKWFCDLTLSTPSRLYWYLTEPKIRYIRSHDPERETSPTSSLQRLAFSSAPIAGLLSEYWSFRLELLMTSIELHEIMLQYSAGTHSSAEDLLRDHAKAHETARLLVGAGPYMETCFEGFLLVQRPLRVAARYFEKCG